MSPKSHWICMDATPSARCTNISEQHFCSSVMFSLFERSTNRPQLIKDLVDPRPSQVMHVHMRRFFSFVFPPDQRQSDRMCERNRSLNLSHRLQLVWSGALRLINMHVTRAAQSGGDKKLSATLSRVFSS